jgi:hypothetical protein
LTPFISTQNHTIEGYTFVLPPVSSTNRTDRQDLREIILKVALNKQTISADVTGNTIKNDFASVIFRQFRRCFGLFDIAGQIKYT